MMKNILSFSLLVVSLIYASAQSEAKDYIINGNQLYEKMDYAKAELQYKQALSKDANSIKANYNLGNTLYQQKKYDEARAHYDRVIRQSKSSKADKHKAFYNIGKTYLDENDAEKAVLNFKEALKLNPYDEQTRYNYALAKKMLQEQQNQKNKDNQQKDKNNKEGENDQDDSESANKENESGEEKENKNKGNQQDQGQNGDKEGNGDDAQDQQIVKGSDGKGKESPEAMNNDYKEGILKALEQQEQETLKKIISQKAKKVRINTEKDW